MDEGLFQQPPTLENGRIQLIPMELEHVQPLFAINHPSIWKFMLTEVKTETDMYNWVARAVQLRQQQKALPFVVILKETNQIVGTTRLYELNKEQRSCELGSTWYDRHFQRTYVNSDCKYLLLQYCFEELKLIRVQLKTDERNLRSQQAIERIGAVKEGLLRNERILDNGYIRNAVLYSIINDEWPSVKQRFFERNGKYAQKQ
ncbi:GNAT family N-acetyltransferase [Heyndrickxia ginsengihumi]|uniref:GNAT family N-acetyltransferase n=1 Tax=Heyndrickxia ginsengihumi TaxID=363870 RepID=A0A0A6XZH1_9BACI|nr:GNAT family N-acetyltransferase [Heyndrickxia ginsengihumi]KHD85507.1 hypothetical protein NG54_09065 [Heyndrickxia ginsengihumi]MCM3024866.1 GNAT family N-acetyltransferase [Heyndrickxia ginsengihumi]NEY20765.1 GNAT family N-acetyltransferase [Heyndrickxia ginsengihumi]